MSPGVTVKEELLPSGSAPGTQALIIANAVPSMTKLIKVFFTFFMLPP